MVVSGQLFPFLAAGLNISARGPRRAKKIFVRQRRVRQMMRSRLGRFSLFIIQVA
jgi:hypothetical protein